MVRTDSLSSLLLIRCKNIYRMDEIEYKLSTNNAILISHAISRIVETVKQKSQELNGGDVSEIPELSLLMSKCESDNALVSVTACHALTTLVESGVLGVATILSRFIASLGTAKNYTAVAAAISNLLLLDLKIHADQNEYVCPFALRAPQHPLITVLNQKKDIWRDVLNQMQCMLNHYRKEIAKCSIELLRPVFLYILCNPASTLSESCKQQTWHLLIKTNNAIHLQIETLLWLQTNNAKSCVNTNCRLLELTELAMLNNEKRLYVALTPLIASLAIELVKHGCDPRTNLDMLLVIAEKGENDATSVTIALLAELILLSPAVYLFDIVRLCATVIEKLSCNSVSAYMLVASLLQWMAYPSLLTSDALESGKNLIGSIVKGNTWSSNTTRLCSNKIFIALKHSDSNVEFYTEACRCGESLNKNNVLRWLENLQDASKDFIYKSKLFLSGLFVQSQNPEVTEKLISILLSGVRESNTFASHLPSLILYKLSNSRDFNETKELLFAVPELAVVKENVPIVVHTLKTLLGSGRPLKQLAVELYLKAWKNEPRCHRYLQAALVDASKNDHFWEMDVTCARAMKHICETRPEHGAELVPLLSQTLNRCGDANGSAASALALKGISALCESGVIDICSTWKVLAPKLNKERRTIVLNSLCELFGDIPSYPSHPSDKFDKLVIEVITKLWSYVSTSEDTEVINSALRALSCYDLELIPLKSLPANFRKDLKLPEKYCKTPEDAAKRPEEVLPYVPGVCWVQMLQNINQAVLESAGDLLISFVKTETSGFHSGIYAVPQGEPSNFNYLSEKSVIRAVGNYLRLSSDSPDQNIRKSIVECLRIFSQKYPKPVPPINWVFLQGTMQMGDDAKKYSICVACRQMTISTSAKRFVENLLSTFEAITQFKEYPMIYSNLEDLCRGVPPNILRTFLEATLNYTLEKAQLDNSESVEMFRDIMEHYKRALKDETIHDANRTLLSIVLEGILDRVDVESKLFEFYVDTAIELSTKHIERMTSPSVWWELTAQKLRKATVIRAELALRRDVDSPLVWMNEVIDAAISMPGEQMYMLKTLQRVQSKMRLEKSSARWMLELMGRIQAILADTTQDRNTEKATFLCDVFLISAICLSASDCLLINGECLAVSRDIRINLFPQAVAGLSQKAFWRDIVSQTMEWLNHMRKSTLPELYRCTFHNALVSLKHERYFGDAWTKYLSIKPNIDLQITL